MKRQPWFKALLIAILILTMPRLFAAAVEFIGIETLVNKPDGRIKVLPYAINLESSAIKTRDSNIQHLNKTNAGLIYVAKVKINNKTYFRLVSGNYSNQKKARLALKKMKKLYPGAWINYRSKQEREKLTAFLSAGVVKPASKKKTRPKPAPEGINKKPLPVTNLSAGKLLKQARQKFLQGEYARVLAIANKVIQTGNDEQRQQALEMTGIVRERRRQFAQAVAIYNKFLAEYPDSPLTDKIKNRLAGLQTMRLEPRAKISARPQKPGDADWDFNGALSQYYRDDVVELDNQNSEEINSSLVTDLNLFAHRKTNTDALQLRFDGGIVSDFLEKEDDARVSRALVGYTNNEFGFQLTAGRQNRTAKGVYGRFDGFVYTGLSNPGFNYSVYTGYPVQSSYDDVDTEQQFYGTSVNFDLFGQLEMDIYLLHQQVSELTDRQALGTEFQYRSEKGFLYGIIDYDVFFKELNNITAISNYRVNDKWVLNLTYDNRFSPLLSTTNALQGQSVDNIADLQLLLSDDQIYQLAADKTSRSQNFFIGSSYQIDLARQLYLSLSFSVIDETVDIPSSENTHVAGDYTIKGYFFDNDYTTFGFRLSDTSSAEVLSLRSRTRFPGAKSIRYDPRLNLDYRQSKISDETQWVLKPSFKITYKPTRNLNLEASFGIEYSNFDLPDATDQTAYNLFLGYVYQF